MHAGDIGWAVEAKTEAWLLLRTLWRVVGEASLSGFSALVFPPPPPPPPFPSSPPPFLDGGLAASLTSESVNKQLGKTGAFIISKWKEGRDLHITYPWESGGNGKGEKNPNFFQGLVVLVLLVEKKECRSTYSVTRCEKSVTRRDQV